MDKKRADSRAGGTGEFCRAHGSTDGLALGTSPSLSGTVSSVGPGVGAQVVALVLLTETCSSVDTPAAAACASSAEAKAPLETAAASSEAIELATSQDEVTPARCVGTVISTPIKTVLSLASRRRRVREMLSSVQPAPAKDDALATIGDMTSRTAFTTTVSPTAPKLVHDASSATRLIETAEVNVSSVDGNGEGRGVVGDGTGIGVGSGTGTGVGEAVGGVVGNTLGGDMGASVGVGVGGGVGSGVGITVVGSGVGTVVVGRVEGSGVGVGLRGAITRLRAGE